MSKLNDYDLYFIHIPKNAGTAFEIEFCNQHMGHNPIVKYHHSIWDKTIAIVRDPFTRLISLYNYAKLNESYWHNVNGNAKYGKHELYDYCSTHSFDEFIKDVCISKKFNTCIHLIHQYKFLLTFDQKIVTHLIRFEHLNEDLSILLNKRINMRKINSSKPGLIGDYYTDESKQLVREFYKEDFELIKNHVTPIYKKTLIYFTCSWEESTSLLVKLKKNTPNNEGIWKTIEGTDNIFKCDYIVVLDNLDQELLKLGPQRFMIIINNNLDKIIHFQRENTAWLNAFPKSWYSQMIPNLKHNYSYEDNFLYTFTTAHFLNKTYDELKALEYKPKTKKISTVMSSKNTGITYTQRRNFLINYSRTYPNTIDIFGKGWSKHELGDNYKGELNSYHQDTNTTTSKYDGLRDYTYSICLENFPNEKVTSEKITDALLAWCMPIYSGSKSTAKYYPEDSFHLIDVTDSQSIEKTYELAETPITQKNIDAIRQARNLILDKYNLWEQIYQIATDVDQFKSLYQYQ